MVVGEINESTDRSSTKEKEFKSIRPEVQLGDLDGETLERKANGTSLAGIQFDMSMRGDR